MRCSSLNEAKSSLAESFSITRGGPLYRLLVRFGLAGQEHPQVIRRTVSAVLVTWLPLLVLSLLQGEAYGTQVKFLSLKTWL